MSEKPWLDEPNYLKWIDQDTGYYCVIRRADVTGALCGYVRIPNNNLRKRISRYIHQRNGISILNGKSVNKKGYNHSVLKNIDVHGGLTFCGTLSRPTGGTHRGLWIGFDCGHASDYMPAMREFLQSIKGVMRDVNIDNESFVFGGNGVYRDLPYVKNEVNGMANYVKKLSDKL